MPAQPWNYYDKPAAQDPFRKWSPMLSIRNAKTPTLVIHSQRDYRLDVSEGFQLFTALQRLNVPSKMLYFPDEGHWVLKPQNSKLWYETVGDWCDRWTKTNAYAEGGYEAAAPVHVAPRAQPGSPGKVSDTRTGVSRPAEVEEDKPVPPEKPSPPERMETPPLEVERSPRRGRTPAVAEPPAAAAESLPEAPAATRPMSTKDKATPNASMKPPANSSASGDGGTSFQIEISAPSDEVQVGGDARIMIVLNNRSDHEILFAHRPGTNNPEFSYKIDVRNAAGHEVEETAYAREARLRQQTEGRSVDYLQPGMSSVQTAHLTRLVNLSRPGRYTVRVSRVDPATHAVVKSNEITLNVVP
jgi:hypothetical protein